MRHETGENIKNMRLYSFRFKILLYSSEGAIKSICALYL